MVFILCCMVYIQNVCMLFACTSGSYRYAETSILERQLWMHLFIVKVALFFFLILFCRFTVRLHLMDALRLLIVLFLGFSFGKEYTCVYLLFF